MARLSSTALISRWGELCHDRTLRDLPYKVELNAWGKLEMTRLTNRRGLFMSQVGSALHALAGGTALMSCGVLTDNRVCVADVAWASDDLMKVYHDAMLFERSPEICVEVCAPDGEEKIDAYLAAGAREVWLVSQEGSIRYFDRSGVRQQSSFPASVSLHLPMRLQ
jgi:hypothetical protein